MVTQLKISYGDICRSKAFGMNLFELTKGSKVMTKRAYEKKKGGRNHGVTVINHWPEVREGKGVTSSNASLLSSV
jgi:hypothetical protein